MKKFIATLLSLIIIISLLSSCSDRNLKKSSRSNNFSKIEIVLGALDKASKQYQNNGAHARIIFNQLDFIIAKGN